MDIDELDNEETPEVPEYKDLVVKEPELEVDLEDDDSKSVTETEEESPQTSDIKAVLHAITPSSKYQRVNDLARPAMVSRIFPDNLLDKQKLVVLSLIEEHDENDSDIPVIDYIMNVQDMFSIGYEGRGIIERLEIAGVAHEEELEKMAKDLMG